MICNLGVLSSNLRFGSKEEKSSVRLDKIGTAHKIYGEFPEWLNGADCKSVGDAFGGSNPSLPTKVNKTATVN